MRPTRTAERSNPRPWSVEPSATGIRPPPCGFGSGDGHHAALTELDTQDREAAKELKDLARRAGSTLNELCGIAERIEAEMLVKVGDPRRFTGTGTSGFARFNGTAPLPASSAEGDGEPVRHRLNRGGNRRVNACLHRMAVTQLRCEPRARKVFDDARARCHTKKEAMRILKRHSATSSTAA